MAGSREQPFYAYNDDSFRRVRHDDSLDFSETFTGLWLAKLTCAHLNLLLESLSVGAREA